MSIQLVTITKTAEIEVDSDDARRWLVATQHYSSKDVSEMTDAEAVEAYMSYAEGCEIDICFDRTICAVTVVS